MAWTASNTGSSIGGALAAALANSNQRPQIKWINTTIKVGNGKEQQVGVDQNGNYYLINSDLTTTPITNKELIGTLQKDNKIMLNVKDLSGLEQKTATPTQTTTPTPQKTTTSTGGGGTPASPSIDLSKYDKKIEDLMAQIEELKKPKVYTAKELADRYGLSDQYNESYWLNKYNEATNKYYDDAVSEQQKLRTDYLVNNYDYTNELVNNYLNGYKNAAPTASGQAAIAANALATQQNANYINSSNDYGMLQSVNQYEEARKAELENNPWLAKQAYNNLGLTLMQLGADHNYADVKKYVGDLDAYANYYDAYRTSQAANASASAAKYAGLASAAATNAGTASNSYNNRLYEQLYNQYSVYGNKSNTAYLNSIGSGR